MLLLVGALAMAVLAAWWPAEVHPSAAPVLAAGVLVLLPAAWRRRSTLRRGWPVVIVPGLWWVCSLAWSWDRAAALEQVCLAVALAVVAWLAARHEPSSTATAALGLGLAGLGAWAAWQVGTGFAAAASGLGSLPEGLRELAAQRLGTGRAFASQPLPADLAVLLATAVPLLLGALRRRPRWPWVLGLALAGTGIVLSRSVTGAALACVAAAALWRPSARRPLRAAAGVLALLLLVGAVLALRGDLLHLEPVRLRLDNWHTALWVWSTAPVAGVGAGGFAQASQAVPFAVGNHPAHAHCLPLEWLAELGPLGLALAAALGWQLIRLARRLWPRHPDLAVALLIVPLHNLVDFSLYLSGVALPWAVVLGWAVASARTDPLPDRSPRGRPLAVAVVAVGLGIALLNAVSWVMEDTAATVAEAHQRAQLALRSRALAPWRLSPVFLAGTAALESGDQRQMAAAVKVCAEAGWLRPHSAALHELEARLARSRGDAVGAAVAAWGAREEQPGSPVYAAASSGLLRWLEAAHR